MPARLQIDGLAEFKALLRQLPEDLRDQARDIVTGHLDAAETTIRASYAGHRRSGNLEKGLQQNKTESRFGIRAILRNRAPHAWLFETGTELPRRGGTGRMPAAKVFLPTVIRARRQMMTDLVALLESRGLRVSGG